MATETGMKVKRFYNETPFPNYELERFGTKEDLKIVASEFARILDRSIPQGATIIDVGTGTGQLAAFLSLRRKCVYGIDFSESSLKKAAALKKKLSLESLHLMQADILDEKQIEGIKQKFDYVLCLGVLHHTGNAYKAFTNILKLLKPNGYICIGLYNKVGRIPLKIRRVLAKTVLRNNEKAKEWFMRMQISDLRDKERLKGWWNDQYMHPHETTHTLGEVLGWFKRNNIQYCGTLPPSSLFDNSELRIAGVWDETAKKPGMPARTIKQLTWMWKTHHEGGYWMTFGRKR